MWYDACARDSFIKLSNWFLTPAFGTAVGEMPVMSPAPASTAEFLLGEGTACCLSAIVSRTSAASYALLSYEAYGGFGALPLLAAGSGVFRVPLFAVLLPCKLAFSALLGVRRAFRFFRGCFFNLKVD